MNTFRQEGIFPPGLSFINTPISTLGYSMPLESYEVQLTIKIGKLWVDYKTGKKTLDEIRTIFANPRAYFKTFEKELRRNYVLANEPEMLFSVNQAVLNRPIGIYYKGGKATKKRKSSHHRKTRSYRRV